jgi:3',5'-cyclic AMP phosphodiesterase CpdA
VVFGNHDHPTGEAGQKSLDDYYAALGTAAVGFAERKGGGRDYCFRIDLRQDGRQLFASLFAFNTGGPATGMKVSASQTQWFLDQIAADQQAGVRTPVLVMQHIPTIEFKEVFEKKLAVGRQGEAVCSEIDKGEIFRHYAQSQRVRAVFCGHDHVNDYTGNLQGVTLTYGRCSGFSGYGDWQRGARLIDIDTAQGHAQTRVVLAKSAHEKPEWSTTLTEAGLY